MAVTDGGGNAPVSVSAPKVAYVTFGCKVNQYDTQAIATALEHAGAGTVQREESPDVVVVNTCTVTTDADVEARRVIRQISKRNPSAKIVVTGCYAEASSDVLRALPNVAHVSGNRGKAALPAHVARLIGLDPGSPAPSEPCSSFHTPSRPREIWPILAGADRMRGKTRAFMKLQDGCDYACSFCIVPTVRGRSRSRPIPELVTEAETLFRAGHRELVLCGVQLGSYGRDLGSCFEDALEAILNVPGDFRVRISSLDPSDVTSRLIELLRSNPKLCPHLHLPIQSGDDGVLAAMRRRYRVAGIRQTVAALQEAVPDIALSADVLVGFPGESDEAYRRTLALIEELGFMRLHVFPYAERPGTDAAEMPQMPRAIRYARCNEAIALSSRLETAFSARFAGREVRVLAESGGTAFSDHRIRFPADGLNPGALTNRPLLTSIRP